MDFSFSLPGSPGGGGNALQPLSHNQQRDGALRHTRTGSGFDESRDSSVHEKISQFNSLAMQSKQLERKTADAALKRAMLGREEAETEMRRYRDEVRHLKKQIDEGKERERRVGERLETVMENYGRAKETHAHTQALWEKEIRRARKETFKSQSVLVKLQEELKSCRTAQKTAEEEFEREKERSKAREQEAFSARYSLVGIQEQLDQALERVKMLEQERDAFKTLAKNEEDLARIAAEGKLPLPSTSSEEDEEDEFASPKKRVRLPSISVADVKSSASSEAEIEELTLLWQWERQRADRAVEHVQFLEAECHLKCCTAAKALRAARLSMSGSTPRRKRASLYKIADAGDLVILSENCAPPSPEIAPSPKRSKTEMLRDREDPRRSTIFIPSEGIFRTVSQADAEAAAKIEASSPPAQSPAEPSPTSSAPPTPATDKNPPVYARTPSVEPPDFAILAHQRTSLLSLLNAPHQQGTTYLAPIQSSIPTTPGPDPSSPADDTTDSDNTPTNNTRPETSHSHPIPASSRSAEPLATKSSVLADVPIIRPHTSAASYVVATKVTTTKVPLRGENKDPSLAARIMKQQRTPSRGASVDDKPSWDVNNPALTPTMTREQALAQIRERRGRARSVGKVLPPVQPVVTPKRPAVGSAGAERREVSAPTGRVGGVLSVGRRARS
ncbi:hypothetical protein B0H63DRAFT_138229 [Podospora didyma]|uniref:Uncharacterized protein n=1 Tax=Podospora didyma TaxID=330526 RepID=A0AAE0NS86_9PEZI|nr:hypothetical protein B0H63DRAFT_138229 [Podospora didyma]